MKNQVKNKNRNNTSYSREFIHFIADLIEPLHIYIYIIYIYIYIYITFTYNIYIYIYNIYI